MLQTIETKTIAAERTPEARDFADRLELLAKDVQLIELAVSGAEDVEADLDCVVLALRKLRADIDELVDLYRLYSYML